MQNANAEARPGDPGVLRWTFANEQAVTAVLDGERAGVYWGGQPTIESVPLVSGTAREISSGHVRVHPAAVRVSSREALSFGTRRAVMVVLGESVFVISQDRKIDRLQLLRRPKLDGSGQLHVSRIHRAMSLGREVIVLSIQWRDELRVGSRRYWGEMHLVRDDGVTVRFGLLEGQPTSIDPRVTVTDDILEVKNVPRALDLRRLETEATVATGLASRASDATNQTLDGWERATELFNPLRPATETPRLDDETGRVVDRALKALGVGRRSVVLRGKSGVGKHTLAREVFSRLPRTWTVFQLTPDALDSASALTGNFSARLLAMKAASETKPVVWFLPHVHAFRDLGTHSRKDTDFFDGILAEMTEGGIRILGTAQDDQYAALVRGRRDLGASFDVVHVDDASDLRVAQIAGDRVRKAWIGIPVDEYHQLRNWAERFAPRTGEPGRTIELLKYALDEAADRQSHFVEMNDVRQALQRRYAVPRAFLDHEVAVETIQTLDRELASNLPGNDDAREAVVGAARAALFDLRAPGRPVATGLFAGPRGAGKTSLVENFARITRLPVLSLSMSSYGSEATAREFQRAFGQWADAHPVGLIFLDELDKSAAKVHDLLLKAFESNEFTYTDDQGLHTVPMANLMIFAATNAGQEMVSVAAKNGRKVASQALRTGVVGALSPYLVDRLDFVEAMYPSDDDVYRGVVGAQVERALAHFGIGADRIVNYDEMLDRLAKDRTAFGSNREAERAVFAAIGNAIGLLLSSKRVERRVDLPGLRFRYDDAGLGIACASNLEDAPEPAKVIPFHPRQSN